MLYLLLEFDELLDTEGRAAGGTVFSPFLEIVRLDNEGCSEDGLVDASKSESSVDDDFVLGPEPFEPSESLDDFCVVKLALDRLLRSLKKGIVPANPLCQVGAALRYPRQAAGTVGKRVEVEVASRRTDFGRACVRTVIARGRNEGRMLNV